MVWYNISNIYVRRDGMITTNKFAKNVRVNIAEEYAEENRAWQGAPSIARTRGGRLYVGFMSGGIYEPDPRNHCLLIYSDDNGETWHGPVLSIESKPDERLRSFEIELWSAPDGELWMFWAETPYKEGLSLPTYEQKIDMENDSEYHALEDMARTYVSVCKNPDSDTPLFSETRYLFNAVVRNRPYICESGRWIFPTYLTGNREYYEFYYSDDKGMTFKTSRCYGRSAGRAYDEPALFRMADGRISAIVRTTPHVYKRMISADEGETWSAPEEFIPAASQRPCAANLADGSVIMIPSISTKARNGFRLLASSDGENFTERLILDDRERISYAEFVEGEDGTLYVAYDRERNNKIKKSLVTGYSEAAKEILFARIPREAIDRGEVTKDTVRERVISKARIDALDNRFTK